MAQTSDQSYRNVTKHPGSLHTQTVKKLTDLKIKTKIFFHERQNIMLDFLTSIYGFSTLFAAAERSEGENRWAVLRMRSSAGGGASVSSTSGDTNRRKLKLLLALNINSTRKLSVINTCNICNMCTAKKCDLILSISLLTKNHVNDKIDLIYPTSGKLTIRR